MSKVEKNIHPPVILRLANGLRLVYQYAPYTRLVYCGVVVNAGTRDELPEECGMAHFIEHMTFKGTEKHTATQILSRLDSVGGELNAYTTKDKTCYYTISANEYFNRSMELLADIVFYSTYPQKEIEKEKMVIREEIDMYLDNPEETILEVFDKLLFGKHALGAPILGTKKTISHFDTTMLKNFFFRCYTSERVVVSIVGNVPPEKIEAVAGKYFSHIQIGTGEMFRQSPEPASKPMQILRHKPYQQANLVLGGIAYPHRQKYYYALQLLLNYLGGPPMNNRLNLAIREKYGLTYNLYAYYNYLPDVGNWGIYAGCDEANVKKVLALIQLEIEKVCLTPPDDILLGKMKKQFIGGLRLSAESLSGQMLGNAKELLDYNNILSLEETIRRLEAVTAAEVQQAALECLTLTLLSKVIFLPDRNLDLFAGHTLN